MSRFEYRESDFWIDWREIDQCSRIMLYEVPEKAREILANPPESATPEFMEDVLLAAEGILQPRIYSDWDHIRGVLRRWPEITLTGLTFSGFDRDILISGSPDGHEQ